MPMAMFLYYFIKSEYLNFSNPNVQCIYLFLEAGANLDVEKVDHFIEFIHLDYRVRREMLCSIKKTYMINRFSTSKGIEKVYQDLSEDFYYYFNENNYGKQCLKELRALTEHGLLEVLEDNILERDSKTKFEGLIDSVHLLPDLYPIYGRMFKIQIKRKLPLYKEKMQKINQAIPCLQMIFQNVCIIPDLVAQNILWNLCTEDIDKLTL